MKSVREIATLVIGLIGIVLAGLGMNHIADVGTCASGGPYVIAQPCPEGSTAWFWLTLAGLLLWILSLFTGERGLFEPGAGLVMWMTGSVGGGIALLINALTEPSISPDSRLGQFIVAAVFIPIGLGGGLIALLIHLRLAGFGDSRARRPRGGARTGDARRRSGSTGAVPDTGRRWNRRKALNDLRSTGALTRAEFDALKADLVHSEPAGPHKPTTDRVALIRQLADQRASGALSAEEFEASKRSVMLG